MLHINRAERADGLIDALGDLLISPLPDPFAPEVICVPTRGMERWLTQRLSGRLGATPGGSDGVCVNIEFPSPRRLVGDAIAAASGVDPDEDPWLPERAVWPLLEVVRRVPAEPWLHSLSQHLSRTAEAPGDGPGARRFSAVRHLAELFDRYALHRPQMVAAWAGGEGTPMERNEPPLAASRAADRRLRNPRSLTPPNRVSADIVGRGLADRSRTMAAVAQQPIRCRRTRARSAA